MANFKSGYVLTNAGLALQAKVEAGKTKLKVTKMALGSGTVESADDYTDRTDLVKTEYSMIISSIEAKDVSCVAKAKVNSQAVTNGFDVTELGLYAMDGETEILYCVAYDEDAMYVPGKSDGSAVECEFSVYIQFATAEKVEIVLPTDVDEIVKWVQNNALACETAVEKSDKAIAAADRAEQEALNATTAAATAESAKKDANSARDRAEAIAIEVKEATEAAATSEANAKASEEKAKASETAAKTSESNAKVSETAAKASEEAAKASEEAAAISETNAKAFETAAKESETKAAASETAAKTSETKAKASETAAKASETAAAKSEANAKASETAAKTSETNAANSESAAAASEAAAKVSETNAKTSETNASASETAAKTSEVNADASAKKAAAEVAKLSSVLKYKGSVATYAELPTENETGDVWNVQKADKTHGIKAGENVAWSGEAWDNLGGTCDMSEYAKEADQQKDVISATVSNDTITLISRDGTNTALQVDNVGHATKAQYDGNMNEIHTTYARLSDFLNLAKVATSGSYNDLTDTPEAYILPTASDSVLGGVKLGSDVSVSDSGILSVTHATTADNATKATNDGDGNAISATYVKKTSLATVATTGSYTDLKNKPTIPEAYTLPTASASTLGGIKVGSGLSVDSSTGTLRAGYDVSISFYDIDRGIFWKQGILNVGYLTMTEYSGNAKTATSAAQDAEGNFIAETYAKKTEVPTKVSELTNDSGFITEMEVQALIDAITSADGKGY